MIFPDWYRALIQWRADYEALLRDILEEKSRPALPEATVADDGTPPISQWDIARLEGLVERAKHLTDLGIYSITGWKLVARCRWHGEQVLLIETTELMPHELEMKCFGCLTNDVERWISITERARLTRTEEGE